MLTVPELVKVPPQVGVGGGLPFAVRPTDGAKPTRLLAWSKTV